MEEFLAGLAGNRGESAVDEAQNVMYEAWEASSKQKRVALARKALQVSPLCADAYVLLAEETAKSLAEAVDLYRKGVEAGELALGEEAFENDVGLFWGLLETRPYMRARLGLAQGLWVSGEREQAVAHYRDMLRLNPNDNQGIRDLLAACLVELERDDELAALLEEYREDASAAWTYTRALAAFRREGDTKASRKLLADALASNAHVPDYLLGKKTLPRARPPYISMGDEDEATVYVEDFGAGWERMPDAVAWLRETLPRLAKPKPDPARP